MAYESILYEKKDRVGIVTLNRPEYLNSSGSPGLSEEMVDVFHEMGNDPEVLATILTGAGRAFCAGHFMRDPETGSRAQPGPHELAGNIAERLLASRAGEGSSLTALAEYRKPLIAAVNGPAYGAGFNMVLLSDIILASTEARFCFPMTRLGFLPGFAGAHRLPLFVGKAKASEMAIMARPVDGEDAYRWGLANKVVAPDQLMDEAMSWAIEITKLAPLSTVLAKEDLAESWNHHIHLESNRLRTTAAGLTADMAEGHRAWRERRAPVFIGR